MKRPTITAGPIVLLLLMLHGFAGAPAHAQRATGSVRVSLAFPTIDLAAGDAAQAAETVRTTFAAYLTGPGIEPVSLAAREAIRAVQKARERDCDYLLHTSVARKPGGRSRFGRTARTLANPVATHVAVSGSISGAARVTAISGVYAAAELASLTRARDRVTLEYSLQPSAGGPPAVDGRSEARARADGEDLLTPLIAAAAEAVAVRLVQP